MLPRLLRVLDDSDATGSDDDPFALALADVRQRIAQHSAPPQLDRWRSAVKEYLFAQVWEAGSREAHLVPSLADYLLMRRSTGATFTCLSLIDVASGHRLEDHEWHHPAVRELSRLTVDLVGFNDDLSSYAKEHQHGHAGHNLVTVLAADRSCSVHDAIDGIALMHCRALSTFSALKATLEREAQGAVRRYVTALEHWIRGHIDWSLESMRFRTEAPLGAKTA